MGENVWLHLQKEHLTGPHQKLHPLCYGSYTITKVVDDNAFELNIPPFLGLYPIFNVALLRPYFPPLLDTSEIAEQWTPTELNLDCMQQESSDEIVGVHTDQGHSIAMDLALSSHQSRAAPAARQVAHPGPNSTEISSYDGGTQCNGDHCFMRRED
jgi:hypothetical protein